MRNCKKYVYDVPIEYAYNPALWDVVPDRIRVHHSDPFHALSQSDEIGNAVDFARELHDHNKN